MQQQQQAAPPVERAQVSHIERELPMLAGIGAFITWCEDLLNILSGPILTAGLAIALVALLTDGDLLVRIPAMLYIWAASMAIGLDAQFIGSAAKLARALRQHRYFAAFGYTVLCAALGYVGYIATNVFATQEANGISTAQALAHLGMDSTSWIVQRSVLAVILVFLSGLLRYVAPATDDALAAQTEAERLDREIELAPKRAQLRAMQARGLRETAAAFRGREQPTPTTIGPVAAAATLPYAEPQAHYSAQAMHDWDEMDYDTSDEIDDEVEVGAEDFSTGILPAVHPATRETKQGGRDRIDSGPTKRNGSKIAPGLRKANAQLRAEAKRIRRGRIRDATYAVLDEWFTAGAGASLSDRELARRVAGRVDFDVNPSGNTVARWRGPWQSSRAHKAAILATDMDDVPPMEPQELRELQEVW